MNEEIYSFKHTSNERTVELSTNNEWITLEELFMLWVDFAAGCGFCINKAEIDSMWAGVENTEKLTKAIEDHEKDISELALHVLSADGQAQEAHQAQLIAEAKLAKAIQALEEVKEFVDDVYPHTEQGTVLVPRLAKAVETLEELKKGQYDE